jgi:alkaline phosphatase D
VRSHTGDEVRTLDDYRARYSQYLGDADLRASRAAAPWLVVWDDHEVENNYAGLVQEAPGEDADFGTRRLHAYQAWWEHMPVRMPRPVAVDDLTIYRSIDWGTLVRVVLLDGRQYRSDQACGDAVLSLDPPCPDAALPERTMLGNEQEAWLSERIATTTQTWTVLGQQTIVSDLRLAGAILNYDQWDGYVPARERLLAAAATAERVVVLTGDIHIAAVGRLPGVGVEFIATSISSAAPALPPEFAGAVGALFPDMLAAEFVHRGYVRHTVTPERWVAEYRIVTDATDPASDVTTWTSFVVDAGVPDVVSEQPQP